MTKEYANSYLTESLRSVWADRWRCFPLSEIRWRAEGSRLIGFRVEILWKISIWVVTRSLFVPCRWVRTLFLLAFSCGKGKNCTWRCVICHIRGVIFTYGKWYAPNGAWYVRVANVVNAPSPLGKVDCVARRMRLPYAFVDINCRARRPRRSVENRIYFKEI